MNPKIKPYIKDGKLTTIPRKQKNKMIVLEYISHFFSEGIEYSEKEVNQIIKKFYSDFAIIRRYLVDFGFLDRNREGSIYIKKENSIDE